MASSLKVFICTILTLTDYESSKVDVLMFEHKSEKLLPRRKFLVRVIKFALFSFSLVIVSLLIGIFGYSQVEGMSLVDSFLNAAMLMGGMGPVGILRTEAGKLFAGIYALYCGMVLIVAVGIAVTPIVHRFFHHFHLEGEKQKQKSSSSN